MKLGLTGGIGCGKSTVGTLLQRLGWRRIDADALVRELLDTDPHVQQALLEHFGPEALLPAAAQDGPAPSAADAAHAATALGDPTHSNPFAAKGIADQRPPAGGAAPIPVARNANRNFIAGRIFANPQERLWLEALLHPRVRQRWETLAAQAGDLPVLIEIPLLFEKSLEKHFDLTVCVEADHHVQLARLQSRGMSLADAEARIASQMPLAEKIARADRVLSNNGTEDFLRTQVLRLHNEWLA